jgi:cell division septal protein FtsQ
MTKRINRTIGSFLLAAAIVAPAVVVAEAAAQEVSVRVYDSNHRDYHNWDDREDRAYRGYLTGRHREYVEYNKQNHREQRNYWNWRHSHPD